MLVVAVETVTVALIMNVSLTYFYANCYHEFYLQFMQRTKTRLEEEAKRKSKQKLQKQFLKNDGKKHREGLEEPVEQ